MICNVERFGTFLRVMQGALESRDCVCTCSITWYVTLRVVSVQVKVCEMVLLGRFLFLLIGLDRRKWAVLDAVLIFLLPCILGTVPMWWAGK